MVLRGKEEGAITATGIRKLYLFVLFVLTGCEQSVNFGLAKLDLVRRHKRGARALFEYRHKQILGLLFRKSKRQRGRIAGTAPSWTCGQRHCCSCWIEVDLDMSNVFRFTLKELRQPCWWLGCQAVI